MSDQDFFFDEDEQATDTKKSAGAKKSDSPARSAAAPAAAGGVMMQSVSVAVASLIGVIALLGGVIIGIVLPVGNGAPLPASTPVTQGSTTGTSTGAPQLSQDQLSSGELPSGHPDISGLNSDSATGTSGK